MRNIRTISTPTFILIIGAFLCLFTPFEIVKAEGKVIGTVGIVRGEAFIKVGSTITRVEANAKIKESDKVDVSERGFVKVLMTDDSIITINEKTSMSFEQYKVKNKNDKKILLKLDVGKVRALITKKIRTGHIKLKTKSVTMGVRGTDFLAHAYEKDGKPETDVLVVSGKVHVNLTRLEIPKFKEVMLDPGNFIKSIDAKVIGNNKAIKKVPVNLMKELKANPDSFIPSSIKGQQEVKNDKVKLKVKKKSVKSSDSSGGATTKVKVQESNQGVEDTSHLKEANAVVEDIKESDDTNVVTSTNENADVVEEETQEALENVVSDVVEKQQESVVSEKLNSLLANPNLSPAARAIILQTLQNQGN